MIVFVTYRFLRLNSQTLALVELHSNSTKPEICQTLYPHSPYLSDSRCQVIKSYDTRSLEDWKREYQCDFDLALEQAKLYLPIDYSDIFLGQRKK